MGQVPREDRRTVLMPDFRPYLGPAWYEPPPGNIDSRYGLVNDPCLCLLYAPHCGHQIRRGWGNTPDRCRLDTEFVVSLSGYLAQRALPLVLWEVVLT